MVLVTVVFKVLNISLYYSNYTNCIGSDIGEQERIAVVNLLNVLS